jgi:hypothetical protein
VVQVKMKKLSFALLLLLAPAHLNAQKLEQLMASANAAEQASRHAEAARAYEELYGLVGFDPVVLYLAGSNAARAGEHAVALAHLRGAVEGGFAHVDRMASDSTFEVLHQDTAWQKLIADARARQAAVDQALRQELLALAEQDQRNRAGIDSVLRQYGRKSPQGDSAIARMAAGDEPVLTRAKAIIATHGWPGRKLVADDGAHAAWLIVQHAPPQYQREVLPLLQAAVKQGDARASDAALLEDRVLIEHGKPQIYGTQLKYPEAGGAATLEPIVDEACVDRRRAAVGLEPLADYVKRMGGTYEGVVGECRN